MSMIGPIVNWLNKNTHRANANSNGKTHFELKLKSRFKFGNWREDKPVFGGKILIKEFRGKWKKNNPTCYHLRSDSYAVVFAFVSFA